MGADLCFAAALARENKLLIAPVHVIAASDPWLRAVQVSSKAIWDILVASSSITPTRSFLRNCSRLSFIVPPDHQQIDLLIQSCLSEVSAADHFILAAYDSCCQCTFSTVCEYVGGRVVFLAK